MNASHRYIWYVSWHSRTGISPGIGSLIQSSDDRSAIFRAAIDHALGRARKAKNRVMVFESWIYDTVTQESVFVVSGNHIVKEIAE